MKQSGVISVLVFLDLKTARSRGVFFYAHEKEPAMQAQRFSSRVFNIFSALGGQPGT
jgi:hypothetical protein